jgi:hypothetical protein
MRRGAVIAVLLGTTALAAPSSATAKITQEDRRFAAAVRAFDAETLAVTHDPVIFDAMRSRQQAAAACVDTARALGARRDGGGFVGEIFYALHVTAPAFAALGPPSDRYAHALRKLRLHDPVLRSARAVQLLNVRAAHALSAVAADFCGPLRTWQDARFDLHAIPPPVDAALAAFRSLSAHDDEHTPKLRRASVRLRAVGVRLAVRERFVGVRSALDLDPMFKDDPVDAALGGGITSP